MADATAELGLRRPRGQPLGNLAEGGVSAGTNDDHGGSPSLNGSAQKNSAARVAYFVFPRWEISCCFVDRQRLASENRLAHVQVLCLQ